MPRFGPQWRVVAAVENGRIQIEPVGPDHRSKLGINANQSEVLGITQRLAHFAPKHLREIDDALAAIIETQTQLMPFKRFCLGHCDHDDNPRAVGVVKSR